MFEKVFILFLFAGAKVGFLGEQIKFLLAAV